MWTLTDTITFALSVCLCALTLVGGGQANAASINVAPLRIQLGSLVFDQRESVPVRARLIVSGISPSVQIVNVDCSHAPGVRVLSESVDHDKVILNFEINVSELCHSAPFGAFIKKDIRLETSSPNEPQFVVPIIGWIDVNNTPRDFNQFVFHGVARWKGMWPTPNIAGALLCAASLFLVGCIAWLGKHLRPCRNWWAMIGLLFTGAAFVLTLILLGLTYSRGAWLATFIALAVTAFFEVSLRKTVLSAAGAFAVIVAFLPSGAQRLESYAEVQNDLSIANRFGLWEGALQMMAASPITGVGSGQFESVFERDYQTFAHTAKTSTAVSDYLTLGAEHGLFVLSLTLGFLLTVLTLSLRQTEKEHGIITPTLAAVLLGILTTSAFSTLLIFPAYQTLSTVTVLGLCGIIVYLGVRENGIRSFGRHLLIRICKLTIASFVVLSGTSIISLSLLPTRSSTIELHANQGTVIVYQGAEPRWKTIRGIILFLTDCNHPDVLLHSTIRPMAAMGWKVIAVPESTNSVLLHALVASFHQSAPKLNLFVAGDSKGGRFAWNVAAQESPDAVKAGGGFNFLSTDMDVAESGSGPRQPFLVYQSLYSEGATSNAAISAHNKVSFTRLPLTVVLSKDNINRFSAGWMTFLVTLSDFFEHENYYASK